MLYLPPQMRAPANVQTYPGVGAGVQPVCILSSVQNERVGLLGAVQVPGKRYQYSVGQHLPVRSFRAAAKPAPDAGFSFIVYGDMGESDDKAAKSPG